MLCVYMQSSKRKAKLTRLRVSPRVMKTIMSAVTIKARPLPAGAAILLDLFEKTGLTGVLLGFGVAVGLWLTKDVMVPVPVPW